MAFTVSAETFAFADGNAGHVCTYTAGAPAVDDWDLLCVNSDTTVSTPSGYTLLESRVVLQGSYVFGRKAAGGEGASVTVTTSGNFNCHVIWVRVRGADVADLSESVTAGAPATTSTPAFTSSALAQSGELALAFAALHGLAAGVPTSPSWSAGYTPLASGFQGGASATGAGGFVAYKAPAGTAAESPSVSWTNSTTNRYLLFATLTPDPGIDGALAATLPALSASAAAALAVDGALAGTLPTLAAAMAQTPNTRAASTAAITAGRTSSAAVSARRTSTSTVTGG